MDISYLLNVNAISFLLLFIISIFMFKDGFMLLVRKENVVLLHERIFLFLCKIVLGNKKYIEFQKGYIIKPRKIEGIGFIFSGFLTLVSSLIFLFEWFKSMF